jgi:hypothetical protein
MSVAAGRVTGVIKIGIAAGAMDGVVRCATHGVINGTTPRRT